MDKSASLNPQDFIAAHTDHLITVILLMIGEIRLVIRQMNSWKAIYSHKIPNGALKSDIEALQNMFQVLFRKI